MRFATKILLLMLAITLGLSGVVVWVVTHRITTAETGRAHEMVNRAIVEYADRIDDHAATIRRIAHLLLGAPQVRAYLEQVDSLARKPPDEFTPAESDSLTATLTQLREEIFGSVMQRELSVGDVKPALHVLVDRRGAVVLVAAPQPLEPAVEARLLGLGWPYQLVIEQQQSPQLYLVVGKHLYLFFPVPLQIELSDTWDYAYFVAYEIDDAWVRMFLHARDWTNLRVVAELDGQVLARSAPADAAEREVARLVQSAQPARLDYPIALDFETPEQRERFIGAALVIPAAQASAHMAFFSSMDTALAPLRRLQRDIALLTGGVVVVAIVVAQIMSRLLAKPVEKLVAGTERIARGQFNVAIDLNRRDELGMLARSFNQMAAGLEQRDLIKDTFGKFVDPMIVRELMNDPTRLKLGGERRVQTVLFADLENFTTVSERLEPETLFRLLNGFLEEAADAVSIHRGIIDKFVGDGLVAFWGPPLEENHAAQACLAALDLVARVRLLEPAWRHAGLPTPRVRVGIATGEVLVGNIGSSSKHNYTIMGDAANLASRLEGVNKVYGTQILVTAHTAGEARGQIVTRRIDTVRVLGRSEPVEIHEVLGEAATTDGDICSRAAAYSAALDLYRSRRFIEARDAFARLDDPPAHAMAARCAALCENDPAVVWDGVWNLERK